MPIDPTMPFASQGGPNDPKLELDYADAFNAYKQKPNKTSRGALLRVIDPVINTAIKSYGGPSTGSPTLKSKARQMAITAFDSYNPQRGTLKTHLLSQLRGLQRHAHQQAQIVRIPEQVGLDKMHLSESVEELTHKLGREPSDRQLADHTGLSLKRIQYIRQAKPTIATGTVLGNKTEEDDHELPESKIPGVDYAAAGWEELVYYDLGDTDQLIFDHLTGRHGKKQKTPFELANMLGVSPSAISQRAKRIQKMLDEQYEGDVF